MSCFFACFRFKDDDQRKPIGIFNSLSSTIRGPAISNKNQLMSLFGIKEKCSPMDRKPPLNRRGELDIDNVDIEIKHEAKFLKSCGALLNTPVEIQGVLEKSLRKNYGNNADSPIPNFHSWLPSESRKQLIWEEEDPPVNLFDPPHVTNKEDSLIAGNNNFSESIDIVHQSSFDSEHTTNNTNASHGSPLQIERQTRPPCSKPSPYPTPLKLSDEMQTPATDYPSRVKNFGMAKKATIRTQYIFPILNPVEKLQQLKARSELSVSSSETFEQEKESNLTKESQAPMISEETPAMVLSSSQWLNNQNKGKDQKGEEISPSEDSEERWWNGNGIRNSTNKYKEDQRVNWHATPFEVRLQKALSVEKIVRKRKPREGKLVEFDDAGEES